MDFFKDRIARVWNYKKYSSLGDVAFFAFIFSSPLENILIYFCDKLITTRELGRQSELGWGRELGSLQMSLENVFGFK